MTKKIRYTMTSKEALLKAIDLVLEANIPGLRKSCGEPMRDYLLAEEAHGIGGSQSFAWEQAFALCVTMYLDFGRIYSDAELAPVKPKVSFSYSGTTHDLASAVAVNELQRRVVTLGAMIEAVLARETIKSQQMSRREERLAADKKDARERYQQHLRRDIGDICPIKDVDKHDIGFAFKEDAKNKKTTFICGASKGG